MKDIARIIVKTLIMIATTMFCAYIVTPEIPFNSGWKIMLAIWILLQFKSISDGISED